MLMLMLVHAHAHRRFSKACRWLVPSWAVEFQKLNVNVSSFSLFIIHSYWRHPQINGDVTDIDADAIHASENLQVSGHRVRCKLQHTCTCIYSRQQLIAHYLELEPGVIDYTSFSG